MAKATQNNNKRTRNTKPRRAAAALRSSSAALRRNDSGTASAKRAAAMPLVAATVMSRPMSEIMEVYIEIPARLMRCRTPFGIWREQAMFAARVFDLIDQSFQREHSGKSQRENQ